MQFERRDYSNEFISKYIQCLEPINKRCNGLVVWKLKCHRCGKTFEGVPVVKKKNYSCGCYKRDRERMGNNFWARLKEEEILNEPYSEEWR